MRGGRRLFGSDGKQSRDGSIEMSKEKGIGGLVSSGFLTCRRNDTRSFVINTHIV
jgi:hypothetical protein